MRHKITNFQRLLIREKKTMKESKFKNNEYYCKVVWNGNLKKKKCRQKKTHRNKFNTKQ